MPQVKYIAKCEKLDSIRGVGMQWEPGQVRNVTAEVAERLTFYSDTWINADPVDMVEAVDKEGEKGVDTPSKQEEEIGLSTEQKVAEEPLPVIDFHAMDKDALIEFASIKYNEKLDKRQSAETLRHKVIALFGQHEMDNG